MNKREEFNSALKESLKNKDQLAVSTIRLILAALKDRDISARGQGSAEGLGESEILSMLQSMIKQRKESAATYKEAGRDDLSSREESEIEVIERFLPKQLSAEETEKIIERIIEEQGASDMKDMGKVMGVLKSDYAGQIDMGRASGMVKQKLS